MRGVINASLASIALYALPLAAWFAPHRVAVVACFVTLAGVGFWLVRQMRQGT